MVLFMFNFYVLGNNISCMVDSQASVTEWLCGIYCIKKKWHKYKGKAKNLRTLTPP